jgi:hypothetical protein
MMMVLRSFRVIGGANLRGRSDADDSLLVGLVEESSAGLGLRSMALQR